MGYYTRFELDINRDGEQVIEALKQSAAYTRFDHSDGTDIWCSEDRWKWYEHEEELKAVSLQFPLSRITVTGYGENDGDIWRKYFVNGKMQSHRLAIEFPPCALVSPGVSLATINVTVLGNDIPVEVEYVGTKTDEQLYAMAKGQIRASL